MLLPTLLICAAAGALPASPFVEDPPPDAAECTVVDEATSDERELRRRPEARASSLRDPLSHLVPTVSLRLWVEPDRMSAETPTATRAVLEAEAATTAGWELAVVWDVLGLYRGLSHAAGGAP